MPPTTEQLDWLVMLYVAAQDTPHSSTEGGLGQAFHAMKDRLSNELPFDATVKVVLLYDGLSNYGGELIAVSERQEKDSQAMVILRDITNELSEEHKKNPDAGGLQSEIFDRDGKIRINSGNWITLREYVTWAVQSYPATNTLLALVGHGAGLLTEAGGETEPKAQQDPAAPQKTGGAAGGSPSVLGLCPDYNNTESATYMRTEQLGSALNGVYKQTGRAIDVLVLDACFMGMFEIAYELHDYAKYIVAGQNMLYAGLRYEQYIAALKPEQGTKPVPPEAIAKRIVELYNKGYYQESWTITAVEASQLKPAAASINAIAGALIKLIEADDTFSTQLNIEGLNIRARIRSAYGAAQKFDANIDGRIDAPSESYVDLFDFCFFLREQLDLALADADTANTKEQPYSSLIAGIKAVLTPIRQLPQWLGDESQRTTAEVPIDTPVTYRPRKWPMPGPTPSSQQATANLIARTHTQSRQDASSYDLRHSYGLSIYLPLGNPPKTLKYYASKDFLRFAGDVPNWVELISKLTGVHVTRSDSVDVLQELIKPDDTYVIRQKVLP